MPRGISQGRDVRQSQDDFTHCGLINAWLMSWYTDRSTDVAWCYCRWNIHGISYGVQSQKCDDSRHHSCLNYFLAVSLYRFAPHISHLTLEQARNLRYLLS
jgi:hypothetical protein